MPMSEAMASPSSPWVRYRLQYSGTDSRVISVPVIAGVRVSLAA